MIQQKIYLSLMLIISIFINVNLLKKVEAVQDELDDVNLSNAEIYTDLERCYELIKIADSRGSFESDDEVGGVFKIIKQNIEILNDKYSMEEIENEK